MSRLFSASPWRMVLAAVTIVPALVAGQSQLCADEPRVEFKQDDAQGKLWVCVDGKNAFCYRYGDKVDLPHLYPINSPAGDSMTVQQTEPYPHHRSFWFGDRVSLEGKRVVTTYNALYTGVKTTGDDSPPSYAAPFQDGVRQVVFENEKTHKDTGRLDFKLLWFMDRDTPILDEHRAMRVKALGDGEYFVDITFTVTATYGDVRFSSDAVHYAWPYIRMNDEFAVPGGARIVGSHGLPSQARINDFAADWVDYSNTTGGKNAGLAMFSHDQNAKPHTWLVRDYGTFGPRRTAAKSGKPFTLLRGKSMTRRIGILVHNGDCESGKVADRYAQYNRGEL